LKYVSIKSTKNDQLEMFIFEAKNAHRKTETTKNKEVDNLSRVNIEGDLKILLEKNKEHISDMIIKDTKNNTE